MLSNLPYVPRKAVLDWMTAAEILQLSTSCKRIYVLLRKMGLKADLVVSFTKHYVVVSTKTGNGLVANIFIGKVLNPCGGEMSTDGGEEISCNIDDVLLSCVPQRIGLVFRAGFPLILDRLLRLFPTSPIETLNIQRNWETREHDVQPFFEALEQLKSRPQGLPVKHVNIYNDWSAGSLPIFDRIHRLVGVTTRRWNPAPETYFPVDTYLESSGLRHVEMSSFLLDDVVFNRILRKWADSADTRPFRITIHTTQPPRMDVLLDGLDARTPATTWIRGQPVYRQYTIHRSTDRSKALVYRNVKTFACVLSITMNNNNT